MIEATVEKFTLKPTEVSWLAIDPETGDYIFKWDHFTIRDHQGLGLIENKHSHVNYRTQPVVDLEGQPVLDEKTGEPKTTGEYYLTLYLEHEMLVPAVDKEGNPVRDDFGRLVTKKSTRAEIVATDLVPEKSEGKPRRIPNRFRRKVISQRKYASGAPGASKRGRPKADPASVKTYQVELGQDRMWHVIKLGQAEPEARFPGTVDGRNLARANATELNKAE